MPTPVINYTPDPIDEYTVIVNYPSDWEEIHNYIINENEIDGIPNRKLECKDARHYCIKTSVYMMSAEEAAVLKTHPKIEHVELNQDKYPQPQSAFELTVKNTGSDPQRYGRNVAFNKPRATPSSSSFNVNNDGFAPATYTNGVRSNWSHSFINTTDSTPFRGVGITTTDTINSDLSFVLDGREVDVIVMDSGVSVLHPEFIDEAGDYRVRDLYLDGPAAVDPGSFQGSLGSQNYTIDGVTIQRPQEGKSKAWWYQNGARTVPFRYNGSPSSVGFVYPPGGFSQYTHVHAHGKTGSGSQIIQSGHGTAVASQVGGKSFGLAFKCNIWNARISVGGNGYFAASTYFNMITNWHKAKKIASENPNPTIVCCSFGGFAGGSSFNAGGTNYSYTYRGTTKTYTGNGSFSSNTNPDAGPFLTYSGSRYTRANATTSPRTATGGWIPENTADSAAVETAISNGVIVVAAAGNMNQKLSTSSDTDFNNYMEFPSGTDNYPNRVGGVQKGFSGDHERLKGVIRVGALDCAVEPYCEKQGVTKFSIRKADYSNNGPMINVYAPASGTMAAAFADYETDSSFNAVTREDSSNFNDVYFGGTSAGAPNTVSLISLYLQNNRSASQSDVATWLDNVGSKTISLSDPYQTGNNSDSTDLTNNYWQGDNLIFADEPGGSYNAKGSGNLRGSVSKVLFNPFVNGLATNRPEVKVINATGISFTHP